MFTVPRLTERYSRRVELVVPNNPQTSAFRFGAANTLDTAFAGTTVMFDLPNQGTYRSRYIRKKQWGLTQYHNRGISRAFYDPEDFWALAPAVMPHDTDIAFLRISQIDNAGVVLPEGPIFVLPPPGFFSTPRPVLTLQGTAPQVAATPTGLPPAGAMHAYLPRYFDYATIINKGAASIWISFNEGLPEIEIGAGISRDIFDAADNEFFVRSNTPGGIAFEMGMAIDNGLTS